MHGGSADLGSRRSIAEHMVRVGELQRCLDGGGKSRK